MDKRTLDADGSGKLINELDGGVFPIKRNSQTFEINNSRELETLRAENEVLIAAGWALNNDVTRFGIKNEALKADAESWKEASLNLSKEFLQEVEAKDAQIRALVEALTEIENDGCTEDFCMNNSSDSSTYCHPCKAKQALSAIPAETLELYRLEREALDAGEDLATTYRRHCELTDRPFEAQAGFSDRPHANLVATHKALEAHKEGKR